MAANDQERRPAAPATRAEAMAQPMVSVRMNVQTVQNHNGILKRLWPGQVVRVAKDLADQWYEFGIADAAGSAKPHTPAEVEAMQDKTPARQEATRTDLRIRSLHGDVAAARQLDALGDEAPTEPVEGTPPPMQLTNEGAPPRQTTGDSARGALAGR